MSINTLYQNINNGAELAETELFKELYERFTQFANRRIWNEQNAEEVVQEALVVVVREYKNIEVRISFSAWAYKVLDNKILSYIKKNRDAQTSSLISESLAEISLAELNPLLKTKLLDCLRKLNKHISRHARILNLSYHGFKSDEICAKMKITKGNFYTILHRARLLLEKCLQTGDIKE